MSQGVFRVCPPASFRRDVDITEPGTGARLRLPLVFKHMGRAALRKHIEGLSGRQDVDILMDCLLGWGAAVVDEHDQPLPFSREALERLVDGYPLAAGEIHDAYLATYQEAAAKN